MAGWHNQLNRLQPVSGLIEQITPTAALRRRIAISAMLPADQRHG